ncbi:MAG: 3-ketosteroid-9-alpha-hydroxylase [Zetaproteobacteria bacterium]|nr:3-ketosteroid-9-alpha-hydroxylase [Pseudobdellovibrionaceae bacterium]
MEKQTVVSPQKHKFPRGWFVIGSSDEYKKGETKALKYFDQEIVAFRGEDNQVYLLDAYCPHLGAHLAHGGKVEGNTIRCPFHAWQFQGKDGKCIDVPYAKRIPRKACVRSWQVVERNGLILVWHDPDGGQPDYEIPILAEYGKSGWTPWHLDRRTIKTHPREIVENVADEAHFKVVHHLKEVSYFENIYENHTATQIMRGMGNHRPISTKATYYGPAYQVTWMQSLVESRLVNAHTPIDENSLHLWFGVMIQNEDFSEEDMVVIRKSLSHMGLPEEFVKSKENLDKIHQAIIQGTRQGYHEDVEIWEHKVYREVPLLCAGDGPIPKLRKWYSQFYQQPSAKTQRVINRESATADSVSDQL